MGLKQQFKESEKEKEIEITIEEPVIYLSGPMAHSPDGGSGWRDEMIEDYGDSFVFADPRNSVDPYNNDVEIINRMSDYDPDSEKKQIFGSQVVQKDEEMIDDCDALFVGLEDVKARGTISEINYAYERAIPVFVWEVDGQEESCWVYDRAETVNENREFVVNSMGVYLE